MRAHTHSQAHTQIQLHLSKKSYLGINPHSPFAHLHLARSESSAPLETECCLLMWNSVSGNRLRVSAELPLPQTLNHLIETLPVVQRWETSGRAARERGVKQLAMFSDLRVDVIAHCCLWSWAENRE